MNMCDARIVTIALPDTQKPRKLILSHIVPIVSLTFDETTNNTEHRAYEIQVWHRYMAYKSPIQY